MKYIESIYKYRTEILFLSYQSVKKNYLQTVFGMGWAVVQPMVYVLTFWFFFSVGLRVGAPVNGVKFVLFLFAGVVPWQFISGAINGGTKIITRNSVLVKTIKFPVMALPLIEVLAKIYVHIVVMVLVMIIFAINGYYPDIYYISFIYYWLYLIIFLTACSFFLSSISILLKDVPALVTSIMQPMFWVTPILWIATGKVEILQKLLNPFYYIIDGYRQTMLYNQFFWEQPFYDIYAWIVTAMIFYLGLKVFTKLRPIMADII